MDEATCKLAVQSLILSRIDYVLLLGAIEHDLTRLQRLQNWAAWLISWVLSWTWPSKECVIAASPLVQSGLALISISSFMCTSAQLYSLAPDHSWTTLMEWSPTKHQGNQILQIFKSHLKTRLFGWPFIFYVHIKSVFYSPCDCRSVFMRIYDLVFVFWFAFSCTALCSLEGRFWKCILGLHLHIT